MSSSKSKLAGFSLPVPNELRLQELYALAQRRHAVLPGPGAYEISLASSSAGSHRRPQQPQLDGPFLLAPDQPSLRCQHISSLLLLRDSGQAPGAYDGPASKDATSCLARAPTPKFGTGSRAGSAPVSMDQLCLSLSRSISSGLNWARPVPLGQLQQHLGSPQTAAAAAACKAAKYSSGHVAACPGHVSVKPCSALPISQQPGKGTEQQQLHHQDTPAAAAATTAPLLHEAACSPPPGSSRLQPSHGGRAASRHAMPWQLAKSITEWEHVAQALKQQQQQVGAPQAQGHCPAQLAAQVGLRCSCSSVVLEEQQVLQHTSAAHAAATVGLLAERRRKWQDLSKTL